MFREGNSVYNVGKGYDGNHTISFSRKDKKKAYTKDSSDVKKEMNSLKLKIYILERNQRRNPTDARQKEIERLQKDLNFWKEEMSKFSSLESHKLLKRSTKKMSEEKLYDLVKDFIFEAKRNEASFVTIEDVALKLSVDKKCLPKIFMRLNREGILSQARHSLMHDSNRDGYQLMPDESGDWAANTYTIL